MTSINSTRNNSVALSLLQRTQVSPLSGNKSQNAANTILDTLSGKIANIRSLAATAQKAKDAIQAAKTPHNAETEGTFLSAWKSAMASVGAAEVCAGGTSIAPAEENEASTAIAFKPLGPSLDNAVAFTGGLVRQIIRYNAQFHLMEVPTREEWTASVLEAEAYRISRGQNPDEAKARTEFALSDQGYQNRVIATEGTNQAMLSNAKDAPEAINNAKDHLSGVFGVKVQIDYDDNGEMKLGYFNLCYANGQTMLSYGEDGSMTTYNQDGNVLETLSHKQVATLGYF